MSELPDLGQMSRETTVDRATVVLLEIAEGEIELNDAGMARLIAAQTLLEQPVDHAAEVAAVITYTAEEVEALVEESFRAGARWRKANPRKRMPTPAQMSEFVGAAS